MQFASHTLLFLNGDPPKKSRILPYLKQNKTIVAVDGGANALLRYKVTPDLVLGDLDSISRKSKSKLNWICIFDQDKTDFEKAVEFLVQRNVKKVTVFGCDGGVWDHQLANAMTVWNYIPRMQFEFIGKDFRAYPLTESSQFKCRKGDRVSLIAVENCKGATLQGLKFSLKNKDLPLGGRGIGNIAIQNKIQVKMKSGKMWVIIL